MTDIDVSLDREAAGGPVRTLMRRLADRRMLPPLIGAVAALAGLLAIHELSGHIHLAEIQAAMAATSASALLPALAFTLVSFAAMALYDVMAVARVAPGRVSWPLSMFGGLVGYGFSNALGFHVFIGGPVRYRIYQAAGLDAGDVGRIVGISALTFAGGLGALLGLALAVDPSSFASLIAIPSEVSRLTGGAILVSLAGAILWLGRAPRSVDVFGWTFLLPSAGSAMAQIVVGAVDIAAAAAVLWVLMPADLAGSFAPFLILFVTGIIAGLIAHAPGGLGILEATILLGLGASGRADAVAGLVLFRIIYYLVPLALAATALIAFEIWRARERVTAGSRRLAAVSRQTVPPIAAVLVFAGGLALLLSGNTPAIAERTSWLADILPLPFVEGSHLLASVTGLLLVVIARGLYRRIAAARVTAIALLLAGAAFSLLKGLDWEEALLLALIAAALLAAGPAFYRKGDWRSFRPDTTWTALMAIVIGLLTLVGFLAYRHVPYDSALWWDFAWHGDAPRFLRATLAIVIVAGAIAVDAVLHRPAPHKIAGRRPIPDEVRRIIARAPGTQPSIALLGDKEFMVSPAGDAFLMYAVSGANWVTMGDPVGDPAAARALVWRFAEAADRAGGRAVFYGVHPDFLPTYLDLGLAILKTGEVARVELPGFSLAGNRRQNLRYAENRATREGISFEVLPKADVPAVMDELKAVSDAWMESKNGREKRFSLGSFDETYLAEFDCAVMKKDGAIVAFANLWRSGDGEELSIDLMRYIPGASKVLMEALFAHLLLYGRDAGYRWFNLGAAPLAGLADHPLASTWNRIGTFVYRRGEEFYNFEGLRAFKQKFDPVWTPQYLACRGGLTLPQILLDVTALIAGGPMGVFKR